MKTQNNDVKSLKWLPIWISHDQKPKQNGICQFYAVCFEGIMIFFSKI